MIRLLPALYAILLACVVFKSLDFLNPIIKYNQWDNIFSNIFLLPLAGDNIILEVTWFVGCLFWVSLFYYALFKLIPSQKVFIFITALITFFSFCAFLNIGFNFHQNVGFIKNGYIRALANIGLGILLYFLMTSVPHLKGQKNTILCSVGETALLLFLLDITTLSFHTQILNSVILFSLFLVLLIKGNGFISQFSKSFPRIIGDSTYMIYLSHQLLFFTILFFFTDTLKNMPITPAVILFIALVFATLCGMILHIGIEKPIQSYLKKKFDCSK